MHNNFIDKNRRLINLRQAEVKGVLPEYFQQSYPQFITLLEKYYDWEESETLADDLPNPSELLHHIFAARDITETDITLLSFIEDELLLGDAYFEGFGQTESELRAAANFSNVLFRSKGTKFAIEWFFRSFYGVDAEVVYPKEDIFNIGDTKSQIGPQSNKFITNDTLYQTWSLLLKSPIPISRWREIFKLFAHPAGMYLSGQVIIDGEVTGSLTGDGLDSAVTSRTTPTYALSLSPSDNELEGSVFAYTLTGNDLPNNGGIAYYYINDTGTATDSDFLVSQPDSASPQVFAISGGTGTFSIATRRDSDETEGNETFGVTVLDDELRTIATDTITIGDVISQYSLIPDLTTSPEGYNWGFQVLGVAGTTPQGNHQLEYYIQSGSQVVDSDFATNQYPTIGNTATVTIVDDSGRFSLQSRVNAISPEADRTFTVEIRTPQSIVKNNSGLLTLTNTVPTFTPTTSAVTIEGDSDLYIDLLVDPTTVGQSVNWSIDSDLDGRLPITSGSFNITSANMSDIFLTEIVPLNTYQGLDKQFANISLTTTGGYLPFTGSTVKQVTNQAPTFNIQSNPAAAAEGDTISLIINTTNVSPGTYYYFIEHITTDNADFSVVPPQSGTRQSFTIAGNQTIISNAFTYTNTGDTDEEFRVYVTDQGPSGGGVLESAVFTIADITASFTLSSSTETANEGDVVTMSYTTNDTDGVWYYWVDGFNVNADDFSDGYRTSSSRGVFDVSGGNGTFDLTLAADLTTELSETVYVYVSKTIYGGVVVTDTFVISDTSTTPNGYTVQVSTSGESANVAREQKTFVVDVTDTGSGGANTLYVEITGIPTSRLAVSETKKTFNYTSGTQNAGTHVTLTNNDFLGTDTGTVTVSTGNYASSGGIVRGSTTFSFLDASSLYTLSSSVSSADEGDTVTFTFSGTNVPSGDYVHHNAAIKGKELTTVYNPLDSRIFLNNTTGLVVGMKCLNSLSTGISSEITNVGTTYVDISPSVPGDAPVVSVGLKMYWGYQGDLDDTDASFTDFTFATGTPETEVFNVTFENDTDVGPEAVIWGVYDDDGNQLVTKTVNVTGDEPFVFITENDSTLRRTSVATAIVNSTYQFRSDGKIWASQPTSQTIVDTGETWIADPAASGFDAADYEIQATLVSESGIGITSGQFGTWATLSSTQTWFTQVIDPNFDHDATITFQVREIANPTGNSDTLQFLNLWSRELYTDTDGGGGDLP